MLHNIQHIHNFESFHQHLELISKLHSSVILLASLTNQKKKAQNPNKIPYIAMYDTIQFQWNTTDMIVP